MAALVAIKELRTSVGQVFELLGNGIRAENGDEGDSRFISDLQDVLNTTNGNLRFDHLTRFCASSSIIN